MALEDIGNKFYTKIFINKSNGLYSLKFSTFFEPDLKTILPTAICIFEDGTGYVSKLLKDLSLASKWK